MSVADRLRVESEQALSLLQESHKSVQNQLAQAFSRQQEKDRELEDLRIEHRDVCYRLSEFTQQQERAELEAMRNPSRLKVMTDSDKEAERQGGEEVHREETQKAMVEEAGAETEAKHEEEENEANLEMDAKSPNPEEGNGSGSLHLRGKGVAEGYLRSLAALERKKEGSEQRGPRRIVMLSERSL